MVLGGGNSKGKDSEAGEGLGHVGESGWWGGGWVLQERSSQARGDSGKGQVPLLEVS